MSTSSSHNTRVTGMSLNPSLSMCSAAAAASTGVFATTMPPPLPRPPIWTWTLTTAPPPTSSAAARASSALGATIPRGVGIPCARNSSLPWCSYRSIGVRTLAGRRRGRLAEAPAQPGDDLGRGRARREDPLDPAIRELRDVLLRDDPAAEHDHLPRAPPAEQLHHLRKERHVRSGMA